MNYLRIIYRNLLKGKVFSFVNVLGLAVGMAAALLIVHYVRFERSYEDYHAKVDNIYRITLNLYKGPEYVMTDCEMFAPVGPMLKEQHAVVLDYVRMYNHSNQEVKTGDVRFFENLVYFADPSLFNVFTINVLRGDAKTALSKPWQTVITESTAIKYFGNTDALGKTLEIGNRPYTVTGVIADVPPNTHLKYDILLSHATLPKMWPDWYRDDWWGGNNEYTYLLMAPGTDLAAFNKKLEAFSLSVKDKISGNRIAAEPMKDIHLYSTKSFEPEATGNAKIVYFLLTIAIFIMIIAWVNYINLSTARAIDRAREVGIRKVMGSARVQLIIQFLAESAFTNFIAALLGLVFFQTALPYFRMLAGQPLPLNILRDATVWSIVAGLFIGGTFISGSYPAFVLSSFLPATVLKGQFRASAHGQWLRKGLVVFQFAATVVLLICVVTVYRQIDFLQHQRLGMDLDKTLVLRGPRLDASDSVYRERYVTLKNALLSLSGVQSVARSEAVPGLSMHELNTMSYITRVGQDRKEGSYNYYIFDIDDDFIPTLKIDMVAGRNFNNITDNIDQVVINEEAVRTLGFASAEEAIGSKITYQTRWQGPPSTIVGVVRNFNHRSPKEKFLPMLFRYGIYPNYVSIRLASDNMPDAVARINQTWKGLFPNSTFEYFFLEQQYNQQYQADRQFGTITAMFSILAMFIACLGLFGLSSFTIVQRTKEIGIRKVMGASVLQIVQLLIKDFLRLVVIAAVLALPVAIWAMEAWLRNYAVQVPLSIWVVAIPVGVILSVAMGTVAVQTMRASVENPVEALKTRG